MLTGACQQPVLLVSIARSKLWFGISFSNCITVFNILHYSNAWWARWRFKSPAFRWFAQAFVKVQIKENIKVPFTDLCEGNPPIPSQKTSNAENSSIWWRHNVIRCTFQQRDTKCTFLWWFGSTDHCLRSQVMDITIWADAMNCELPVTDTSTHTTQSHFFVSSFVKRWSGPYCNKHRCAMSEFEPTKYGVK